MIINDPDIISELSGLHTITTVDWTTLCGDCLITSQTRTLYMLMSIFPLKGWLMYVYFCNENP